MEIIVASQNAHKVEEINEIVKLYGYSDIKFLPINPALNFNPEENGSTFEENSFIKAKAANILTGKMTIADDSGLCVDALDGAPGLYSARYAQTPQGRIDKLLKELAPFKDRSAKFVCVLTLLDENGQVLLTTRGECKGEIATKQSGTHGFGYDPVFIVDGTEKTMAEMSENEKNRISHRSLALQKVLAHLN